MTDPPTTRLHITPLTLDLFPSVLPASLQSSATEVSFHSIPTFPENAYGYVTLPTIEAEKFKKKMDGSMLKGKKFRVEVARPKKRYRDEEEIADSVTKPIKTSKKRRTEDGVLDGHELTDRQVKRGWTESSNAKQERRKEEKKKGKGTEETKTKTQPKSKYTDKPECLFRTQVPPNRAPAAADEKQAKKKKKKQSKESVVHEFSNTVTYPTFVRSATEDVPPSATFQDGKGWVDDSGNLKEPVSDRIRSDQFKPGQVPGAKEKRKPAKALPVELDSISQKSKEESPSTKAALESEDESSDWTSSSGDSSSDDSASESDDSTSSPSSESDVSDDDQELEPSSKDTKSADSSKPPQEDPKLSQAETADEPPSADVHPLEALYKRPAPDSSESRPSWEVNTQFSFFGNNDIESEEEDEKTEEPYTPYTKKDMQERGLRSAAPTPDTALPNRRILWDEPDAEEGDVNSTPIRKPRTAAAQTEESDFAKWFWDNRGDNNRAWKKRRRDAAKEERQRENRRKGMKGKS